MNRVANTVRYLRACQARRAAGLPVSYTNDPQWLVHTAINRRAGELDDPHARVTSHMNHRGTFPRFCVGDARRHLEQLAHRINTPRLRVYRSELGEWGPYLLARLPDRFATYND